MHCQSLSRNSEGPHEAGLKLYGRLDYRARVGDYRILYYIDDAAQLVTVWRIAHRRDVYRGWSGSKPLAKLAEEVAAG